MAKVLLIESDCQLARNLTQALFAGEHEVMWALEPQEAICLADATTPEVVITDLLLAGRTGIEFIYEFVSYPEWADIPVILLSSVPEAEVNTNGNTITEINIQKFIYKPHGSLKQVVEAVNHALSLVKT